MTIQAITFDFWSTLYRHTHTPKSRRQQQIRAALATVGRDDVAEEQIAAAMNQAWHHWDKVWRAEHRTLGASNWLTFVLDQVGAPLPETVFNQTVYALQRSVLTGDVIPVDGAPQVLAWLSKHYRMGIISDTALAPGQVLRTLLERDGLLPYFTHLTFSDELGRSKPDPLVFHSALEQLNVLPHQAVHIGDLRHTDIFGAREVGMGTIRYAGVRDDLDSEYPEADVVIKTYDALLHYFLCLFEDEPRKEGREI